jgi:D-alanyl-lipoteichoic acid acyltransferase DltB (MBOAT superfamily)
MIFNSLEFLAFFPIVTLLYFVVPRRMQWALLLIASCIFYMAFRPVYVLILVFTILVDYVAGLLIAPAVGWRRRAWLGASIAANVGVLAVFKYWNFAAGNLNGLAGRPLVPLLDILLPIGLSFHTFQAMSYTIEVYRGRQPPERHLGIYALYVMFYPQLVAGPIERPQNLLPQFRDGHEFDAARVTRGLSLMMWGFFKKIVVADRLAIAVNHVYARPGDFDGAALLLATYAFAFQIYCDFSGYSDIALGSAEVMGFELMKNFDRPYASASVAEFWRRWHISLSTWFRDYLYIPLGGSKVGPARTGANLLIVFLVSGLWHGANWTYVAWGALHGLYIIVGRATEGARRWLAVPRFVSTLITFHLVTAGCRVPVRRAPRRPRDRPLPRRGTPRALARRGARPLRPPRRRGQRRGAGGGPVGAGARLDPFACRRLLPARAMGRLLRGDRRHPPVRKVRCPGIHLLPVLRRRGATSRRRPSSWPSRSSCSSLSRVGRTARASGTTGQRASRRRRPSAFSSPGRPGWPRPSMRTRSRRRSTGAASTWAWATRRSSSTTSGSTGCSTRTRTT